MGTRLWSQVGRGLKGVDRGRAIRITSLNIRPGRAGGLQVALRELQQGNTRTGVLQETKLAKGIHTCYSVGYKVWSTEVESRHRDKIPTVWIEEAGWQVEDATRFGPNVESFTITAGRNNRMSSANMCPPMINCW